MDRQRLSILLALALVFIGATVFYFVQVSNEGKTRFRTGYPIPRNLLPKDLLTDAEKIPDGPPQAPEIRPTDPLLYGNASSLVTVIVFGDFQSDLSKQQAFAIRDAVHLLNRGNDVRVIWRDFPLTSEHSRALLLATAARCAGTEGKFREMHDLIFSEGSSYDLAELTRFARKLGLNEGRFSVCLRDPAVPYAISEDVRAAQFLAIKGVPTLFVNGFPFIGFVDADSLATIFRRDLSLP